MELVYLWVEDYKNIKNQGFNFSPRFECEFFPEYDTYQENGEEKKKLKDNCKLEIKPKEYTSIFPDNINVTAIVGENGSGKSSIIELIRFIIGGKPNRFSALMVFYIIDNKESRYIVLNTTGNQILSKNIQYVTTFYCNMYKVKFPTFDYSLTYNSLNDYYYETSYNQPLYPKKYKGKINIFKSNREYIKHILINYQTIKENHKWSIFQEFFIPSKIHIFIDINKFSTHNLLESKRPEAEELKYDILNKLERNDYNLELISKMKELSGITSSIDNIANFDKIFSLGDMVELDESKFTQKLINKNIYHGFRRDRQDGEFKTHKIFEWDIDTLSQDEINHIVDWFIQPYFFVDIEDTVNNKFFNDLSSGEQQLLNTLNTVYYLGHKNNAVDNLIIFIDEIELGIHPMWNKKIVKYLCDYLTNIISKNFHIIIASHSPFILSDLPKENVIFLKKDENGNCKNVTKETNIETFGANIHTLLSHGFFMKDGLMGEFAKGKINDVYNFLIGEQSNVKTKEEAENIINLVGEPLIKRQLEDVYNKKFQLKSKDEIIQELQNKIAQLEKSQNDKN